MLRDYYGRAPPSFFECCNAATGRSLSGNRVRACLKERFGEPHELGFGQLTSTPALSFRSGTDFSGGSLIPETITAAVGISTTGLSLTLRTVGPRVASSGLRWQGLRGATLLGPLDSLACDRQP